MLPADLYSIPFAIGDKKRLLFGEMLQETVGEQPWISMIHGDQ